jgi:hypothetical protein
VRILGHSKVALGHYVVVLELCVVFFEGLWEREGERERERDSFLSPLRKTDLIHGRTHGIIK